MILLDMDGVCADFVQAACDVHNKPASDVDCWNFFEKWGMTEDEFWAPINAAGRDFWANLKPYPWFDSLVGNVRRACPDFHICTKPSRHADCLAGKLDWIQRYFGKRFRNYIFTPHKALLAKQDVLLIDDSDENCASFRESGGNAFLWSQPWNTARSSEPGDLTWLHETLDTYSTERAA